MAEGKSERREGRSGRTDGYNPLTSVIKWKQKGSNRTVSRGRAKTEKKRESDREARQYPLARMKCHPPDTDQRFVWIALLPNHLYILEAFSLSLFCFIETILFDQELLGSISSFCCSSTTQVFSSNFNELYREYGTLLYTRGYEVISRGINVK